MTVYRDGGHDKWLREFEWREQREDHQVVRDMSWSGYNNTTTLWIVSRNCDSGSIATNWHCHCLRPHRYNSQGCQLMAVKVAVVCPVLAQRGLLDVTVTLT